MFFIPLLVIILTGNQTESPIRKQLAETADGKHTSTRGIHAVAGIGPKNLIIGLNQ